MNESNTHIGSTASRARAATTRKPQDKGSTAVRDKAKLSKGLHTLPPET